MPPTDAADLPIVFVEVQGYRDQNNVLYSSFFGQIFLYLHDYKPLNDWYALLIFTKRSLDPGLPEHYRVFALSPQFQRIYLDELNETTDLSLGLRVLRLIGLEQDAAPAEGRQLVEKTRREINDVKVIQKFIELIETILVYKFSELSREEITAMLRLDDLKQTRVYRDALEEGLKEGKLAAVPLLLKAGMTVEQIAEQLQVDLVAVQEVAAQNSESESSGKHSNEES